MGRGWKRATNVSTAPVPYPTVVFQGAQTKSESEKLRGHQPECAADPDLDSPDAMLLLKWLHHLSSAKWSFSNLASMLRLNLFTYRDLRRWLENPFGTPPLVPLADQLSLQLS